MSFKKVLCCLLLLPLFLFAQDIQWSCTPTQDDQSCNGYVTTDAGKTLVIKNASSYMVQMSSLQTLSTRLSSVVTGCGTGCSGNVFVNMATGQVSIPFQNVVAVNPSKNVVAIANLSGVLVQSIFKPNQKYQIKLDLDQQIAIPAYMIRSAHFLENGDLNITYVNSSGDDTTQSFSINYQQLALSHS